jgi:hypothetical protein
MLYTSPLEGFKLTTSVVIGTNHQIRVKVRHNFVYTIKSAHAGTSIKETPVLKGHHYGKMLPWQHN